jgi:hypothetical protein
MGNTGLMIPRMDSLIQSIGSEMPFGLTVKRHQPIQSELSKRYDGSDDRNSV